MTSSNKIIALSITIACVGLGLGIIIGFFGIQKSPQPPHIEDDSISEKLMKEISNENIRQNLRDFTMRPHIAGRQVDEEYLVNMIQSKWLENGLDKVVVQPYNVLLSYPVQNDSNYVARLDQDGKEVDISQRKEKIIDPEQNDPDVVDPFNAYSAAGKPEGELVYVNYGTIEDFIYVNRTAGINTDGKICISRYGAIFRGDKAIHAQQYGCAGLILYSDPADYTVPWSGVYPDSWYLPSTGVQRGTLWTDNGDPRTPNYPSTDTAWHMNETDISLPKIPVTPIGYIDAVKYLEKMDGPVVPESWRGGLNITYKYGPGFAAPYDTNQMKMNVKTYTEAVNIKNVIGYIRGTIEPDRYVILGNHRDAWVFGGIDPSSGTAAIMEVVRAFGEMVKQGWRPRRTLVFCSWAAEEYGLIGSTERVEEFQKELQGRAIAYLNVDSTISGNYTLEGTGVYSLRDVVFEAAKLVKNPNLDEIAAGRPTVYDTWKANLPDEKKSGIPSFASLGSGSDFAPFQHVIGISSISLDYTYDSSIGLASYPVYHSVYETFELMSRFVDPDFTYHQAVTRVWGEVARRLSDSVVLPIDPRLYATDLERKQDELIQEFGTDMQSHSIDLSQLDDAISAFGDAADSIYQKSLQVNHNDLYEVRLVNDQLMQLERAFIGMNPLPGRTAYRHVISAPSLHNIYGNTAFPGLVDSMFDIDVDPDQEGRWDEVKRQYSVVIFHINAAASTMRPVVPK